VLFIVLKIVQFKVLVGQANPKVVVDIKFEGFEALQKDNPSQIKLFAFVEQWLVNVCNTRPFRY
jgi:hypothetical protein